MSTNRRIYLDFNATTPLGEPARTAMMSAMADIGNPSSVHTEGRRARDRVERARRAVATLAGRPPEQVVFTSGGTEANALGIAALAAAAEKRGLPRIAVTTPLEHPSLSGPIDALRGRGWQVRRLRVDETTGFHVDDEPVGLFASSLVNHELGTLLPAAVLAWARARGALILVDAVQAAGKLALAPVDADALTISAHKLAGPQGAGALVIAADEGLPLVDGGHQERGRRPGTENQLGIIGFGAAAAAAGQDLAAWPRVVALGDRLEQGIRAIADSRIHGASLPRVGGTINAGFSGALGESIVIALDLAGIAASTGAACTSGSIQPSSVLLGLGYPPDRAREGVRFSLGHPTTTDEIDAVLTVLPEIVARARRYKSP